jgi:hypothetical protein
MPVHPGSTAMPDRLADMSKMFRSWKASHSALQALHFGTLAWIEGWEIPDIEELHRPDSILGRLVVHKAYVEQTSSGWNLLFRGFWSILGRQAQEHKFSRSPLVVYIL